MARSAAAAAAAAAPRAFSSLGPRCGGRTRLTAATTTTTSTTVAYKRPRFLLQHQQHRRYARNQQAQRQYCTLWRDRSQPQSSSALIPASRRTPFAGPCAAKSITSQSAHFRTHASEEKTATRLRKEPAPGTPVSEDSRTVKDKAQAQPLDKATIYGLLVAQTRGAASPFPTPSTSPVPYNGSTPQPSASLAQGEPRLTLSANKLTLCEHPSSTEAYTVTISVRPRNTFMSLNSPVGKHIFTASLGQLGYRNGKKRGFEPSYQLGVHIAQKIESRRIPVRLVEICLQGFGIGRDAAVRGFMSATRRQVIRLTDRTWVNWNGNPRPRSCPRR